MRKSLALGLLLCTGPVAAAQQPQDFAYAVRLDADGTEALYQVLLPAAVYRGVVHADLADVRVFNAAGQVVPHALRPRHTVDTALANSIPLTLFPLKANEGIGVDGISVRLRRSADGSSSVDVTTTGSPGGSAKRTVGYLVDLTALDRPLRAIELDWQPFPDGFAGQMRVDASDDLGSWHTLVSAAPLVGLEIASQRLDHKRIELPPRDVKYLRLSWVSPSVGEAPQLVSASGQPAETTMDAAREWTQVEAVAGDSPGEYAFDLLGHYPVDRVRVRLPEVNTVVQVEWLVRDGIEQSWRPVAHGVVYRLRRDDGEIVSPEMPVGLVTDRYWLLRVDRRGGGVGSGTPRLEAGWVPHAVVFTARGEPPFQLAYGNRDALPAAYAIETLVPAKAEARNVIKVASALVSEHKELGGEARRKAAVDWKRWTLWGSLVLGVLLLGGMAWRLAAQLEAGSDSSQRE